MPPKRPPPGTPCVMANGQPGVISLKGRCVKPEGRAGRQASSSLLQAALAAPLPPPVAAAPPPPLSFGELLERSKATTSQIERILLKARRGPTKVPRAGSRSLPKGFPRRVREPTPVRAVNIPILEAQTPLATKPQRGSSAPTLASVDPETATSLLTATARRARDFIPVFTALLPNFEGSGLEGLVEDSLQSSSIRADIAELDGSSLALFTEKLDEALRTSQPDLVRELILTARFN